MAELAPWLQPTQTDFAPTPEADKPPPAPWLTQAPATTPAAPAPSNLAPWLTGSAQSQSSATTPAQPAAADLPMPGPLDALMSGLRRSVSEGGQSVQTIQGQQPSNLPIETGPQAAPFELRDLYEPSRGLSKLAYGVGESSPTLAAGIAGGAAGSLIGPEGTLAGGAGGAALGAAFQAIGPSFAEQLRRTPHDPDGAWTRAMEDATASGVFSGASWAAFPLKAFSGPLKNLAFQAFGIQPGLSMAEQATKNVIGGDDVTKGLKEAYTSGAVTTAVPALGHLALRGRYGEPQTQTTEPSPAEIAAAVSEHQKKAADYATQAAQPGISPTQAEKFTQLSDHYTNIANAMADRQSAKQRAQLAQSQAEQLEQRSKNPSLTPPQRDTLLEQARTQREQARQDNFIGNIPPPLPPKPGGLIGRLKEGFINNIAPDMRSEAALKADAVVAKFRSARSQLEDSIINRGEKTYAYKWPKVDPADQDRFLFAVETGSPLPADVLGRHPWMDNAARDYRSQLDLSYRLEKDMGSRADYLENYFPHIWKDPARARQVFSPENLSQSMGPTWFQKARTYDLIEMGKQNGLELRHNNIQDIVNSRLMSGADMINKMEMLHDLQSLGVATPAERAPAHVSNPSLIGSPFRWDQVTAPSGEKWLLAPDVQSLWKNGVEAKGLWANEGAAGDAFRSWMKLKNAWVPIKLGLSFFHPVHVAHISAVNNMSRAIGETFGKGQQSLARRFVAMPEAVLQTVGDAFFGLPIGTPNRGKTMRESWITPRENQTPAQKAAVQLMNEAGISAQLSEQMRIRAKRDFHDAVANNQYLKTLPAGFRLGLEKLSSWMFEEWIPNLKMAALQRESEALFRRRPDLLTDTSNRRVALRALGKQIDNRFGEMSYGGLFWNRTLKDASIGSFLSLGWNLGFAREFGGGFFEPIVRRMIDAPSPTRALVRQTTNKTTNMLLYGVTAMAINAAMNKAFTGDNAEGLDYIFPRIGGLNPDGSPRRITNAFYTREVPMAMKNIEEQQSVPAGLAQMLYHKMLFQPFIEMGQNKDYFGNQIYDENAPFFKQAYQFGSHLVSDQLNPMSVAGAKRALQLSGKPNTTLDVLKQLTDRDVVLPFLGFGPAPAYASKSPLENRIQYLFKRYVAPEAKSFETGAKSVEKSEARTAYLGAMQRGDQQAKIEAAKKLAALGVQTKEINKLQPGGSIQYMFQRLPAPDQKALLKTMSKEEFKQFFPKAQKRLRGDPEVTALARHWYEPQ